MAITSKARWARGGSRAACAGLIGIAVALGAQAQTPGTVAKPWTLEGSMRLQQEERERNQRSQRQAESQQRQADADWEANVQQQQARSAANAAEGRAVLQAWQQRPPLPPDRNPLLGRWHSQGNGKANRAAAGGNDLAALANALVGGMTAGLCDSMLGQGLVDFRPTTVVAVGADGRERVKYRAQYRGGGSRVVVLPQDAATFTHMIIDFNGTGRATVAGVGCALVRADGGAPMARSTTAVDEPAAAMEAPARSSAVQWDLLGTSDAEGGIDIYVARATIRRAGASAQMSDLFDFKRPHTTDGRRYLSARNRYEYDCAGTRRRMLGSVGFADHMGRGATVASFSDALPWESVPAAGPARATWRVACGKG